MHNLLKSFTIAAIFLAEVMNSQASTASPFPSTKDDNLILAQASRSIRVKEIKLQPYSKKSDLALRDAIAVAIRQKYPGWKDLEDRFSSMQYHFTQKDINNDGKPDAFVGINSVIGSGTGGKHV